MGVGEQGITRFSCSRDGLLSCGQKAASLQSLKHWGRRRLCQTQLRGWSAVATQSRGGVSTFELESLSGHSLSGISTGQRQTRFKATRIVSVVVCQFT